MKSILQKIANSLFISFLMLLSITEAVAQTTVSYTAMTSITCPATPVATISGAPAGVTFSQISRGAGVSCGAAGGSISGSGFNGTLAANIAASKWYTYTITTDAATSLTLNSLSIVGRVSNVTLTPNVSVQYSIGAGVKTVIGSYTPTTSAATYVITPAAPIAVAANQVITIFIIPNGLTASGTTCRLENATSANITASAGPASPTVTTSLINPSNVTSTTAILSGDVTSIGGSAVSANGIVYGQTSLAPTPTLGALDVTDLPATTPGLGTFFTNASGLSPNIQYSFRAYATNLQDTSYGATQTFYSLANVPTNPTVDAATSSSLNVTIGSGDGNSAATQYAIQVNGGLFVQASGALGALPVWQTSATWATTTVTGLTSFTEYVFAVIARNGANFASEISGNVNGITLFNLAATLNLDSALTPFGDACVGSVSTQSFTISGINLDGSNLELASSSLNYIFSDTEFGIYSDNLSLFYAGTTTTATVFVRFTPTAIQSYPATLAITGGGLTSAFNVLASGQGLVDPGTVTTEVASGITATGATLPATTGDGCTPITNSGIEYSSDSTFATSTLIPSLPATISGLTPNTTYFYRGFAVDGTGTINGATLSFTTSNIDAPLATPASAIQDVAFVANWNAVAEATSYSLNVSTSPTFGTLVPASNLIISEYGEGSGGNKKYIEIYNGTGTVVNLANYELWKNVNGSNWNFNSTNTIATLPLSLTGTLASGATYVIANNATDVIGANLYNTFLTFNGDDATGLAWNGGSGTTFTLIDAVGVQGIDPGAGWAVAGIANATVDKILIRKDTVLAPNTNWTTSAGTSVADSEWIVSSSAYTLTSQTTNLGSHSMSNGVASYLPGYENLAVTSTSQLVTGLSDGNTYYYRVSAVSATSSSAESNVVSVFTVLPIKTKLVTAQCGGSVASMATLIFANNIPSATSYRFKVTNPLTSNFVLFETSNRYFSLRSLSSYEFATTYNVEVELQIAGVWAGFYGDSCTITSPALPTLTVGAGCVTNIATRFSGITTANIAGVTQYKFRITRVAIGAPVQEVTTNWNGFLMHYLGGFVYGSTYNVEVAVKTTGDFSAFSSSCVVNTPAVPTLSAGSCNATITGNYQGIFTQNLGGNATGYKFECTSTTGVVTFDTTLNWFYPTAIPGYVAGTNYSVRVAVKNGADISEYGEACELNPVTPSRFGQAGNPITNGLEFKAMGYPNPFATNFTLNVTTTSDEKVQVTVYDMIGKQLESKEVTAVDANALEVGANYPSGVYNVIVSQGVNVKSLRMIKR